MKKVLKFGTIGIVGWVLILVLISAFKDGETPPAEKPSQINSLQDTEEVIADARKKDSLRISEEKELKKADSLREIQRQEALVQLNKFRKKHDEFNNITFYRDNRTPVYANRNFIYPYILKKGDKYLMQLRLQYTSDSWLFINSARIKTDNSDYTITGDFERDNHSEIWEWYDEVVSAEELKMLEDIANSKVVKVRYEGSQYYDDRIITAKEKDIIKKTLGIYSKINKRIDIKYPNQPG